MNPPLPPPAVPPPATPPARWLRPARVVVVTVTALALVIAGVGLPLRFARLHTVCAADPCPAGAFAGQKGQLGPAGARALRERGLPLGLYAAYLTTLDLVRSAVGLGLAGWLLWRRARREAAERMALFLALFFVSFGVSVPLDALAATWPAWGWPATAQHTLGGTALFTLFFYLFPDGRFVPRWARWLAVALLASQVLPLLFPGAPVDAAWTPAAPVLAQLGWWLTGVGAQVYRYRRVSDAVQHQQTKWVVGGFAATAGTILGAVVLATLVPAARQPGALPELALQTVVDLALLLVPAAIGLAVLRHRLWDIDLLINRALVYGALTASVIALYVLVVGALGTLLQARGSLAIALAATGLVAVLFQPLRDRLQRGVNRLFYGERDEPHAVLARLGRRLAGTLPPDAVLPTVVATVREALKLPYAAVALAQEDGPALAAAAGAPVPDPLRVPLVYRGEQVGQLLAGPRAPGEPFTPADRRLLDQLARHAGAAVHGVRLTADLQRLTTELQRARERLVLAREEERRRLRRDLHDDLAPTLAALALTAATAGDLIASAPARAEVLVTALRASLRATVGDVRRLAYDLRPPTLDELGLVAAIRERAAQYDGHHRLDDGADLPDGLRVAVEAPEHLPPLPAAVEVAAYRIAQEALMNVARHARARGCVIRLAPGVADAGARQLLVEVTDDGVGVPEGHRAGVGLRSMRERAAELGGTCTIERLTPAGTRVSARLPLPEEETDGPAAYPDRR